MRQNSYLIFELFSVGDQEFEDFQKKMFSYVIY